VIYVSSDDLFVALCDYIMDQEVIPLVVSISYGADEYELGEDWCTRSSTEFGKLALMGVSVFASSGDSGTLGNDDDCEFLTASDVTSDSDVTVKSDKSLGSKRTSDAGDSVSASDYVYVASFPASSPYVTAVGGTTGGSVPASMDESTNEDAWYYAGGGFSAYFAQPDWQSSAVSSYLSCADCLTEEKKTRFDPSMRAYPDISAQSVDYVIAYEQEFYTVSGTSASSPTVAGLFSLINYARLNAGKSSLGFLNPSIYALYDEDQSYYYNDVVNGYNEGCSVDDSIGFYAQQGWDPLTGVGTPKFQRIFEALVEQD
jgi:tripeptidyl-peptidase-1